MATINYKGMKLEILEPQIFDYPKTCVVWDIDNPSPNGFSVKQVLAVLPMSFRKAAGIKPVITNDRTQWNFCALLPEPQKPRRATNRELARWNFCALLPEPQKPRRATNRELARWLAQGNGEWGISKFGVIEKAKIGWFYDTGYEKETLQSELRVRKWSDTEWHEPDVEYLGIND